MIDFRAEHTGNAAVDRIQAAIRALASLTSSAVAVLRRTHGADGLAQVAMQDADRVLVAAEHGTATQRYIGAISTARAVRYPAPTTDATSYLRWVSNATTGGFALTIGTGTGATVSVPAGSHYAIRFSTGGCIALSTG